MATREESEQERLARLRRNHEQNRAILKEAKLAPDTAPILCCRNCRLLENALFWTPRSHLEHSLSLQCPSCERYGVRYDLRRGTVSYGRGPLRLRPRGSVFRLGLNSLVALVVLLGLASVAIPELRERPARTIRAAGDALERSAPSRSTRWLFGGWGAAGSEEGTPYLHRGDLRGEFDGPGTEEGVADVKYLEERDLTIVTVLPGSSRLQAKLVKEGWTRL